jgi:hypothetical protein
MVYTERPKKSDVLIYGIFICRRGAKKTDLFVIIIPVGMPGNADRRTDKKGPLKEQEIKCSYKKLK